MESLGIDIKLILVQAFNFFVLLFVLNKLLYKTILKNLEKRRQQIAEGIQLQEDLKQKDEKLEASRAKILERAEEEGQEILKSAVIDSKKRGERILEEYRLKAAEEKTKLLTQVEQEKNRTIEQAKRQAIDYAILIANRVLTKKIGKHEQKELVAQAIKDVSRS